jgi:tellurite resistance protein TehA-like permease
VPYNVAWWGCVFPFVTQLNSTYQLYVDTKFGFFMWAGRVFCIAIFLMALYVHYKTLHRVLNGSIWQTFKPKAT